jgi:hypothetical protein
MLKIDSFLLVYLLFQPDEGERGREEEEKEEGKMREQRRKYQT